MLSLIGLPLRSAKNGQFPRCGNLTFTAAILPAVLHIAVGRKRVGAKTRFSAVGGVLARKKLTPKRVKYGKTVK